jgi:hypothetical protein
VLVIHKLTLSLPNLFPDKFVSEKKSLSSYRPGQFMGADADFVASLPIRTWTFIGWYRDKNIAIFALLPTPS